jgi:hypothetical protein
MSISVDETTMPQASLTDRIQSLDDATARRVLTTFARAQSPQPETQLTPALAQALREFAPEPAAGPVTEGDIARTALLLLADDPHQQPILTALINGPGPQKMAVLETTGVIVAVLMALQTQVKFERDKDGRYSFKIEKKPTDAGLLKTLIQGLLKLKTV